MECLAVVDPSQFSSLTGQKYCQKPATRGCTFCYLFLCDEHCTEIEGADACYDCRNGWEQREGADEFYPDPRDYV